MCFESNNQIQNGFGVLGVDAAKKKGKNMNKKRLLMLLLLSLSLGVAMAQDVIVKKDGSTILSKVLEISETEIKYKKWSNQDGPMYTISRNEVNSINYQNGEVELIFVESQSQPKGYVNSTTELTNGRMERRGRDLFLDDKELSEEEVLLLIGQQNYETYLSAKKQIGLGRVFTPIFFASLGATVLFSIVGLADEEDLLWVAMGTGIVADISLPLMLVFKGVGKGRMNWVADEYNKNGRASAFSYQLSPSIIRCNSLESQNNLGLGLTFSINF